MAFVPLFCETHHSPRAVPSSADLVRRARDLGYRSLGICDEGTMAGYREFDEACESAGVRPIFGCRLRLDGLVASDRDFPIDFLIESDQGYRNLVRVLTEHHDSRDRNPALPRKLGLKGRTRGLIAVLPPDGELAEFVRRRDRDRVERYIQLAVEYFGRDFAIGIDGAPGDYADPRPPGADGREYDPGPPEDGPSLFQAIPFKAKASSASASPHAAWSMAPGAESGTPASSKSGPTISVPIAMVSPVSAFTLGLSPDAGPVESAVARVEADASRGEPEAALGATPEPEPDAAPRETMPALLRALADFVGVRLVAAPRVRILRPEDEPALVFLANPRGAPGPAWSPSPADGDLPLPRDEEEMRARFSTDEEALHASDELARRCEWRPGVVRRAFPSPDFERGFDPKSFLFDTVIRGAARLYGEITEEVKDRINREFQEIAARDLAPWFLLNRQICERLDERGVPRGVGRGSALASVVARACGISRVDPLEFRLAQTPHDEEERNYPPIRLELPSSARGELVEWLRATFGETRVARIGRRPTRSQEEILDLLGEWCGASEPELRAAMRSGAGQGSLRAPLTLHALPDEPAPGESVPWSHPRLLARMAETLVGRPGELEPDPDRWTVTGEPLDGIAPTVSRPGGERVTDIDARALDRLGCPCVEFASSRMMDLIEGTRRAAAPGAVPAEIPSEDRAAFELMASGETVGIPPFENPTVRFLLRKHRPTSVLQVLRVLTDAGKERPGARRDLHDELPDAILGCRLAWLQANVPIAFHAAALTCAREAGRDPAPLARAIHRSGFELVPPDIHLSLGPCQVFGGRIRIGLRMIRNLDEAALEEILQVRQGGGFESLEDLRSRVSSRKVTLRALQHLIAAGALDCFEREAGGRAAMWAAISKTSGGSGTFSTLSAGVSPVPAPSTLLAIRGGSRPSNPSAASEITPARAEAARLRREREALGFNPGLDPLGAFPRTLKALRPLAPQKIVARLDGRPVRMAGFVDAIDDAGPILGPAGGPAGARLVDVEGTAVHVPAALARLVRRVLRPGEAVFVAGRANLREGYPRIEAEGVWRLADLEEQSARVATVRLRLEGENRETLALISDLASEYRGATRIELEGYPGRRGFTWRRLRARRVFFCSPLFQALAKILPADRIELLDSEGALLPTTTARGDGGY